MEITLGILLYFLRALCPKIVNRPSKESCFMGTYQFYGAQADCSKDGAWSGENFRDQYLYVADLSELYRFRHVITPEMTVLASEDCQLSAEQLSEFCCGLILVDGRYKVAYLVNRMINVFGFLANWDKNMHIAALEGKSVQDLLNLSEQVLQQPIILYDSGFDVLAYTKNVSTSYAMYQETIKKGYTDPSIMERIRKEHILSQLRSGEILVAPAVGDRSLTNIYLAFRGSGNILGYACVFLDSKETEEGYLDLLRIFAQNLTFCLKRDFEKERFGQMMYEPFLLNLMNPAAVSKEQVAEQIKYIDGLAEYGRYVLGVISFEDESSVPLAFVARQCAQEMWDVKPFIYEKQICMLRILGKEAPPFGKLADSDAEKLEKILKGYSYTFGVSNEFTYIMDLRHGFRQAQTAVRFGRMENRTFCCYSEYMPFDLFEVMEHRMPVQFMVSDLYRQLQEYDSAHQTRYCQMIQAYLDWDCNATHTAEKLFVHRNTIRRAVWFVEEKFGVSLDDPVVKKQMMLSGLIEQYIKLKEKENM